MRAGLRAVGLGVVTAALVAGSWWGASSAFGAAHTTKNTVVFKTEHVAGVSGQVLVEGPGLVVYTFTGDRQGHAGTCTASCAAAWPPVHGVPALAHGVKIGGKFGRIDGQVTYNGWPLYLFTGEKAGQDHANSSFKVVHPAAWHAPAPSPSPSSMPTYGYGM